MQHQIVSRDEWLAARKELLRKEKEFTRLRDQLSAERRALPWVKVEKNYVFDGPNGKVTLADLFDGRSQLVVKHFMFGPDWTEGCVGCSFELDHTVGALVHLEHHDVSYAVVSRAPLAKTEPFRQRMGWRGQVGVVVRQRLQPRLPRVVHAGGDRRRQGHLQLPDRCQRDRRDVRPQRVLQGRGRPDLPHLLVVRARRRDVPRQLRLP